jgi:hypothetical protein
MRILWLLLFLSACSGGAGAPARAPDGDLGSEREKALIRGQHRAGEASRAWEEARFQLKLAEQDVLNAEDAHRQAGADKAERKQQLDAAKKALAVARSKEAAARQAYDKAVLDVDRARR